MYIKKIRTRSPLSIHRVPLLAKYYRFAYQSRGSRKKELLLFVPSQKLFALCRSLGLLPHIGEFEYDYFGDKKTVCFDSKNLQFSALYGRIYEEGYEQEIGLLIDCLLPNDGVFYDIGSNWGYYTLYAASLHRSLTLHAFEPFPTSHEDLKNCIYQAGLSEKVSCHQFALSNKDSEAFIDIADQLHSGTAEISSNNGTNRIKTCRLDSLNLKHPNFIKMDVEGHEAEVIQGAYQTLNKARPFIVFESRREYAVPEKTVEPLLELERLGYDFYIPSLRKSFSGADFILPSGWQMDISRIQAYHDGDSLVLVPMNPRLRYLYQHDLNIFACHKSRHSELEAVFAPWNPSNKVTK